MPNKAFQQFRDTISMPEVGALRLYYDGAGVKSAYDELKISGLHGKYMSMKPVLLKEKLPIMNAFMDTVSTQSAYAVLRGLKNKFNFYLNLRYTDFGDNKTFYATLAPKHKMDFPEHHKIYNEWQEKLRNLLGELYI